MNESIGKLSITEINQRFESGMGLACVAAEAGVTTSKLYRELHKLGYRYVKFGRLEPIHARPISEQAA